MKCGAFGFLAAACVKGSGEGFLAGGALGHLVRNGSLLWEGRFFEIGKRGADTEV